MKTLQQEMAVKWEEQQRARQNVFASVPSFQLEFTHNDVDVILDTSSLLLTYAEFNHSTEVPRLVSFIKEILPLYFGFDQGKFQQSIQGRFNSSNTDDDMEEDSPVPDDVFARSRKINGKKDDLRRGVLERGRSGRPAQRDKEDSLAASSRGSTPDGASAADDEVTGVTEGPERKSETIEDIAPEKWVEHPIEGNTFNMRNLRPEEPYRRDTYHLYANLHVFCFFRMFFTLYERLKRLKDSEPEVHQAVDRAMQHKAAMDLNMIDKLPSDFFYEVGPACNYYSQMLRMMNEQVQQEVEMTQIEETLRRYYLQNGHQLYQLDKLLSALTRFAIGIMTNDGKDKSWDIMQLFKKDRTHEQTTHQDELNYRKQVEKYCKEGDIYRFTFVSFTFLSLSLYCYKTTFWYLVSTFSLVYHHTGLIPFLYSIEIRCVPKSRSSKRTTLPLTSTPCLPRTVGRTTSRPTRTFLPPKAYLWISHTPLCFVEIYLSTILSASIRT